ncbi:MAG: dTDP-4-dehydrorhamnose 3,5-epimerase [Thermoanaerobaculia bacterium]
MKFVETGLEGAYLIELEPIVDARGFFARAFCVNELRQRGLDPTVAQCNVSTNHRRGTLRGMHYQLPPAAEGKLVRCTRGAIWDAIIDLRPESATFGRSFGVELSADNRRALYVPEMFAHGYLTLTDDAEVHYMVTEPYSPGSEAGLRYDDAAFGVEWPIEVEVISDKDAAWPLWAERQESCA